jgi:hypothetical protein
MIRDNGVLLGFGFQLSKFLFAHFSGTASKLEERLCVRAREVGHHPPRLFVSLVRQRLGQNITQTQEERARLALARFRERRPRRISRKPGE